MTLETTIKQLPDSAGIYQYFDKDGRLLYIGKAKNLSKRVKSYFSFSPVLSVKAKLSPRITKMINQTISLNYIVVNSEHDALILENSLIKQLNPKYNILLRDDKTYPYIYIDNSQDYPRYEITRKIIKSKNIKYYGPYSVGARDILDSIYELCKLVQKKGCLKSKKLCLYYQIDKCLGPCELNISKDTYKEEVNLAQELIENKNILIKKLQERMLFYSEEMRFEEALELRDRIERISKSEIKSDIDFASNENYDIFALQHTDKKAVIIKIFMRNGKIISSSHEYINLNEGFDESEIYQRAILNFYGNNKPPILAQILVASDFESKYIIEKHLYEVFGKKTPLQVPKIGSKKHLIDLALLNAKELLKKDKIINNEKLLLDIKELLNLQRVPSRVETFDNSHISGTATVGAMIVWQENAFDKASYRTYHLDAKDEYAQMHETLTRRVNSFSKNSPPDLWIIDGGSTLLKLASEILESNGIFLDVIAISKEKIDAKVINSNCKTNLPKKSHRAKGKANDILHTLNNTFKLKNTDKRLQWAQNLRDEAHRCAIAFHKKTKLKLDQESQLLGLKGISQAKVIKLLKYFESFEALKQVSLEDISDILNTKDAKIIKSIYN